MQLTDKNDSYFYLSGLLSFLLFALVFVLAFTVIAEEERLISFAMKKDTVVTISLDNLKTKKIVKKNRPQPKSSPKPKVVEKTSTPDISSLFASVNAKKVQKKKKVEKVKINKEILKKLNKKAESVEKNKIVDANEKIKELDFSKVEIPQEAQSDSTADEVNEYYARVQALVYDNFFPVNSQDSAKVKICIGSNGTLLRYVVVQYSNSTAFNSEVDSVKDRLASVSMPKPPSEKNSCFALRLTAK